MARLSTATRYKVVILHQQGLSQAKISKQTGVSRCAIQALLKKHKETGDVGDRRRSGRPRKISAADERRIMLTSLRKMSSSAISSELAETSGTQVHPSTVRRSLARSELHRRLEELLESEQEDNQLYLSQLPETLHNRENMTKTPSKKEIVTETPQNKENMPKKYSSRSGSANKGQEHPKGSKNKTFLVCPTRVYSVREGKSPVSSPKKHSAVKNQNGVEAPSRGRGRPKGSTKPAVAIALGTQEKRNQEFPKKIILRPSSLSFLTPKSPKGRPNSTDSIVPVPTDLLKRSEDYRNVEEEDDDDDDDDTEDDDDLDDDDDDMEDEDDDDDDDDSE